MIDKSLVNKIFLACQDNNVEYLKTRDVKELLNAKDEREATCVHYSVRGGNNSGVDALEYLVKECGSSIKPKSNIGALPIHDACTKGNLEAVSWLLSNSDSGINTADICGTLPIHLAAGFGYLDIVELLVKEHNTKLNVKTKNGARPIHFAVSNGHSHVVKFIIDYFKAKAEEFESEADGIDHHHGADEPNEACPLCVLDSIVNAQMDSGATPAYLASQDGQFEILQYLVYEGKANTKILAYDGMSCLHAAAQNGHFNIVQWLINDQKLGMNAKEIDGGMTVLHFATGSGRVNMVEWLLQNGAKISTDLVGGTPLHSAAHYGYVECAKMILEYGCNPDLEDADGLTATDIAAMSAQYGYAGFITRWKKEKASEEARLKQIAATVLENMRRKIPGHLKIPTLPAGMTNGENGEDEEPDYEKAVCMEDMIAIPPPPSYPPPDIPSPPSYPPPEVPTSPTEHKLQRQSRMDETNQDREQSSTHSTPNKFRMIAQMKKASIEKRSDRSSDSRSNSPTPGNSVPSSRSNSFRAVAKFKQTSIKKRNIHESEKTTEVKDQTISSRSNSFRAVAKFKQASIEKRNQSSPDRSSDADSKPSSPGRSSRKQSFKAIAKIKQASIEKRTRSSSEKSSGDDSRSASPNNFTSSRSNSFKAIAKFKQMSVEKRSQSSLDRLSDDESGNRRSISPKEIDRIKKEEIIEKKPGQMKRQNSFKLIANMKKATMIHGSNETNKHGQYEDNEDVFTHEEKSDTTRSEGQDSDENRSQPMFASNKVLNKMKAWASSSKSDSQDSLPPFKEQDEDDYKTEANISDEKSQNALKDGMKVNKDNQNIQTKEDMSKREHKSPKPSFVKSQANFKSDNQNNNKNSTFIKPDNNTNSQKQTDNKFANTFDNKYANTSDKHAVGKRSSVTSRWPPSPADNNNDADDTVSEAGSNENNKLVVDELKDPSVRSSLRKAKQNGKGKSMIFFGATSPTAQRENKTTPSSLQKPNATVLIGEFDPKNFLDKVPNLDTTGNIMPPWKKMLMAKQEAEKAYTEMVERRKKEEQEARYREMPVWKREILRKKEEERMALQAQ